MRSFTTAYILLAKGPTSFCFLKESIAPKSLWHKLSQDSQWSLSDQGVLPGWTLSRPKACFSGTSTDLWLASISFNDRHKESLGILNSLSSRPGLPSGEFLQQRKSPTQRDIWPKAKVRWQTHLSALAERRKAVWKRVLCSSTFLCALAHLKARPSVSCL